MAGFEAQPKVLQTHCCVLMLTEATHQVWRGQEPLWRDVSWDMSSGKCQGGVNSISKINGECWKWHLLVSDQIGGRKRNKQKRHRSPQPPSPSVSGESFNRPCTSSTCPEISQCVAFTFDLAAFQTAAFVLVSYSPSAFPDISPAGLQSHLLWGSSSQPRFLRLGLGYLVLQEGLSCL